MRRGRAIRGSDRSNSVPSPSGSAPEYRSVGGGDLAARFATDGFIGPVDFIPPAECSLLSRCFDAADRPAPLDWCKGSVASDRVVYDVATRPLVASLLTELLGPNVILWGASVVDRTPGEAHAWHTDIESSAPDARCVTVWVGLENTSVESSLKLIRGSHRIGKALQMVAAERGVPRDARTTDVALECARAYLSDATVIEPAMENGQALLFDGRVWHGSLNSQVSGRRRSLVLQYAAAGASLCAYPTGVTSNGRSCSGPRRFPP